MVKKNKINYSNGKVYKIIGLDADAKCYVGSTTKQYLSQRMTKHVESYKRWKNGKKIAHYSSFDLFDQYGVENCKIILLELCDVTSRDSLRQKEQKWINETDCVNKFRAYVTKEQRTEDKRLKNKKYSIKHREQAKVYHIKYKEKHLEAIQKNKQRWYEKNKELNKTIVHCEICDCNTTKTNLARHNSSKKHLDKLITCDITKLNFDETIKRLEHMKNVVLNLII